MSDSASGPGARRFESARVSNDVSLAWLGSFILMMSLALSFARPEAHSSRSARA